MGVGESNEVARCSAMPKFSVCKTRTLKEDSLSHRGGCVDNKLQALYDIYLKFSGNLGKYSISPIWRG
jgi:hypothetical protein